MNSNLKLPQYIRLLTDRSFTTLCYVPSTLFVNEHIVMNIYFRGGDLSLLFFIKLLIVREQ